MFFNMVAQYSRALIKALCLGGYVTWRISPLTKWLVIPFISHVGHLEGEEPYLGGLLTMVINHLLTGIILQVGGVG